MTLQLGVKFFRRYLPLDQVAVRNHFSVSLIPTAEVSAPEAAVDVALVLDNSGSMAGPLIRKVIHAAYALAMELRPHDRMTVISFSDEARVVVPLSAGSDLSAFAPLASYEAYKQRQVSMGGTCMYAGLRLAVQELRHHRQAGRLAAILLFTDGLDIRRRKTMSLVEEIAQHGLALSCLGFGEYDLGYLEKLTAPLQGFVRHIENTDQIMVILRDLLHKAQRALATNIQVMLRLQEPHSLLESYTVYPEVRAHQLPKASPIWRLSLANVDAEQGLRLFFVTAHGPQPPGEQEIGRLELRYDLPAQGRYHQLVSQSLRLTYTAERTTYEQRNPDPELQEDAQNAAAERMRKQALQVIAQGDPHQADDILMTQQKVYEQLGDQRRVALVQQTRQRLEHGDHDAAQKILWGTRQRPENINRS